MKVIFHLLVMFSPTFGFAQNHADCDSAFFACDKNRLHFIGQSGEGAVIETEKAGCFMNSLSFGNPEKSSVWIRFDIEEAGTVSFGIVPDTLTDDIDFVVFTLPLTGDCKWKWAIRCMAAGDKPENAPTSLCMGATGLREGENDESEDAGCSDKSDNNWLAPLKVKTGEKYVLLVSNMTAPYNGFKIRFGGTATFACDDPATGGKE
jgi:hypothetical protein